MPNRAGIWKLAATAAATLAVAACTQSHSPSPAHPLIEAAAPLFDFPTECPPGTMDACHEKLEAFPDAFGTERDRSPKGGGSKKQKVLIMAYQGSKDVSVASPPTQATLILRLANHGKVTTDLYDLDPSSQADYYVTVKGESGVAKWTLWRVPMANGGTVTSVSGTYTDCKPPMTSPWAYSIADFADCTTAPHLPGFHKASMEGFFIKPMTMLWATILQPPSLDVPGWFACAEGCCTM